jgi:anti-sigma B factor antagonist
MKIAEQSQGGTVVLQPTGAVGGAEADRLGQRLAELIEASQERIVVDLAMVTQLDSRALEVLVEATEKLIRFGKALVLASPSDLVREVLELTEVASMFEQHDDLGPALGSLQ